MKRKEVTREEYEVEVNKIIDEWRINLAGYADDVTIVSSFASHLRYHFSQSKGPTNVLRIEKCCSVSGQTPDLVVTFTNGYTVVAERKRSWYRANVASEVDVNSSSSESEVGRQGRSRRTARLDQLVRYKQLAAEISASVGPVTSSVRANNNSAVTPASDVVLLVGQGADELAVEEISEYERLGNQSIVTFEVVIDHMRVRGLATRFTWRNLGGMNKRFEVRNTKVDSNDIDLNELLIGENKFFIARSDDETLLQARLSPLLNDVPPVFYTFFRVVLPYINSVMSQSQKNDIAQGRTVQVSVRLSKVLDYVAGNYQDTPVEKLEPWINNDIEALVIAGVLSRSKGDSDRFTIQLSGSNGKLQQEKLIEKLVKARLSSELKVSREVKVGDQLILDID